MVHLQFCRNVSACFRDDLDATLDRTSQFEVTTVGPETDPFNHFGYHINIFKNVGQPDELRAGYH